MKIVLITLLICLLVSPAYPLGKKVEEELYLRRLADSLGSGNRTVEKASRAVSEYVHNNMKSLTGENPYEKISVYKRLKLGIGWCNHQVEAFMLLISYIGVSSRMVYLMDGKGNSPHTIAEVFDGEKWLVVDVGNDLKLRKDGKMVTREDIREDFTILTENEEVKHLAKIDPEHWGNEEYLRMFTNSAKIVKIRQEDRWKLGERRRF